MLEPAKSKFKEVTLDAGPIMKTHKANKTGAPRTRPARLGRLPAQPGSGGAALAPLPPPLSSPPPRSRAPLSPAPHACPVGLETKRPYKWGPLGGYY